jgi:hypothetical protein
MKVHRIDHVGIIGLQDVNAEAIMLRTPGGEANLEPAKFYSPTDELMSPPVRLLPVAPAPPPQE